MASSPNRRTTSVARWPLTGANVRSELSKAVKVTEATGDASEIYLSPRNYAAASSRATSAILTIWFATK